MSCERSRIRSSLFVCFALVLLTVQLEWVLSSYMATFFTARLQSTHLYTQRSTSTVFTSLLKPEDAAGGAVAASTPGVDFSAGAGAAANASPMNGSVPPLLQLFNSSSSSLAPEAKRIAFLIRTHKITPGKVDRFKKWISDLLSIIGINHVDIWFIVDVTRNDVAKELDNALGPRFKPFYKVFSFTVEGIVEQFPKIKLFKHKPKRHTGGYAWLFLQQPIIMWWRSVQKVADYAKVWAIEDDTDLCGRMSSLLLDYELDSNYAKSDLISNLLKPVNESWYHFNRTSENYAKLIGPDERYFSHEHLQMYSHRFLDHMLKASDLGIHAPGEQFTPSLCQKLSTIGECEYGLMKPVHIGHKYDWNTRVGKEEFDMLCSTKVGRGKLFHAFKW